MINLNGQIIETIEDLEIAIASLSEETKAHLRAEFNNEPISSLPPIPSVTPRQIRQALILSGQSLDTITTAINSLPEPTKSLAMAEWEYSTAFERHRPLVNQMAAMLGWTQQQLDDLWNFALTL